MQIRVSGSIRKIVNYQCCPLPDNQINSHVERVPECVFVLFLVCWLLSLFFLAWGLVIRLVARMGCAWHWRRKLKTSLQLTVFGVSRLFKPGTLNYDIWGSRADIFVNGSIII